jgi:imidazolonepropionase-like amidohydrolase
MRASGTVRSATCLAVLGLLPLLATTANSAATSSSLLFRNARIITGTGDIIEKGDLLTKDGRIAVVGGHVAAVSGAKVIDASGMTLIAGYIDDHRHLIQARDSEAVAKFMKEQAPASMLHLLESGVTTVQSGGDDNAGILQLKHQIEIGQIKGPRIIASGQVQTWRLKDEAEVRAAVDKVIKDGADSVAEVHYPNVVWPYNPTELESKNLAAGIDEAKKLGVEFQVHAVSDLSMVGAVRLGAKKLVHSVNINWVGVEQAKEVAASGAQVASITGFGSPNFNVFSNDNKPKFRDGKPWPEGIVDSQGVGQEAGYMPVNLRTLYDNGVDVSYATDTVFDGRAALAHELKSLSLVFSPLDLIKIMGINSAKFVDKQNDLGTLEPGKIADIIALGGNPLDGYWNFLTAVIVVKQGVVMIDKRGQPDAGKPVARAM